jgi:hypothetical protein
MKLESQTKSAILLIIGLYVIFSVAIQGQNIWQSFVDSSGFPLADIILTGLALALVTGIIPLMALGASK